MVQNIKNFVHGIEAGVAGLLYGSPSKKLFVVGVTGTDGKTTTSGIISHILTESGKNPALITTVGAQIGDKVFDTGFHTTTPTSFALQKYINSAVKQKCDYLVLETTSHALDQNRVKGIVFKVAVLTNVSHEHLDYHKTYENYVKTKTRLLSRAEVALTNMDDKSYNLVKSFYKGNKLLTYSLKNSSADFNLKSIGMEFPAQFKFNLQNFLAAVAVSQLLGIDKRFVQKAVLSFRFPEGRQELVYDKDFKVYIDFAHTPNSFEMVLPELKKLAKGRLIHVFGAAGLRDKSKRPLMGEISSNFADVIVLTAEDPRSESIEQINSQIKLRTPNITWSDINSYSASGGKIGVEIFDRRKAITEAIKMALPGDIVVITGKGHEKSMNLGDGEIPWNEHELVAEVTSSLKSASS